MIFESIAIIAIILAIIVISARMSRNGALALVPLLIQPVANILGIMFDGPLTKILPIDMATAFIGINILFLVISSLLVGLFVSYFEQRKSKILYSSTCIVFNLLLVVFFVSSYLA